MRYSRRVAVAFAAIVLPLAAPTSAFPCSMGPGFVDFLRPQLPPLDRTKIDAFWAAIPPPIVEIKRLERATWSRTDSCGDLGYVELSIKTQPSAYPLEKLGIYLRLIGGNAPAPGIGIAGWGRREDSFFPTVPIVGKIANGEMIVAFSWFEKPPPEQPPVDMTVEAFFVTDQLAISPSVVFEIKK